MAKTPARKTAAKPKPAAPASTPAAADVGGEAETAAEGASEVAGVDQAEGADEAVKAEAAAPTAAPVPPPADPSGKRWYSVVSPLDHDQELHAIGAELQLTEDQAKPLLGHTVTLMPGG